MMKLFRISLQSGLSTLVKLTSGLVSLKLVALYLGPSGLAIIGQLMTLAAVFSVLGGGGITLGVIKYVAEYASTPSKLYPFIANATYYSLFFSLLVLILGFLFSTSLSVLFFGSAVYALYIQWLSAVQFFVAMHGLWCSIITGLGRVRQLLMINTVCSLINVILMAIFSIYYQLEGALTAVVISQGVMIFISLGMVYRERWFSILGSFRLNLQSIFQLSQFSFMTIISTLTVPVAQLIVRHDLSSLFGWQSVGQWQAVLRLSDVYLTLVTTILMTYYLPRLSQLEGTSALKQEMSKTCQFILPVVALSLIVVYLNRLLCLQLLYSNAFLNAGDLFLYQLLGDFFRIAGWLFTYLLLAKSCTKLYVTTEIILSVLFIITSHVLAREHGLIGVTYAFSLTYIFYFVMMAGVVCLYFNQEEKACLRVVNP